MIIDEGVLKFTLQAFPSDVRLAQLHHLIERDGDPFTTVRIVPLDAPLRETRIDPFDIFEFPEANDRVTVAYSFTGASVSSLDATPTWEEIEQGLALPSDESRKVIRHHMAELKRA